MSAVKEWFGAYNIVFRHIRETYGPKELDKYLKFIADEANSDISDRMRDKPVKESVKWFAEQFRLDGADIAISESVAETVITVRQCAAYDYMNHSTNPFDKAEEYYCDCCRKLNGRICENAGIRLDISDVNRCGQCRWTFSKEAKRFFDN